MRRGLTLNCLYVNNKIGVGWGESGFLCKLQNSKKASHKYLVNRFSRLKRDRCGACKSANFVFKTVFFINNFHFNCNSDSSYFYIYFVMKQNLNREIILFLLFLYISILLCLLNKPIVFPSITYRNAYQYRYP